MTSKLEFCLLGPVAVRRGGAAVPVPRGKQRAVLAVLLLSAGRVDRRHRIGAGTGASSGQRGRR